MSSGDVIAIRQRSRAAALEYIRRTGGCSRADLMGELGLSRGGVAHLVTALVEAGEVEVRLDRTGRGKRGRPSATIYFKSPASLVAGLDFGHSHVAVALADLAGDIVAEIETPLDPEMNVHGVVGLAVAGYQELVAEHSGDRPVVSIAAGVPVPLDRATGTMRAPIRKSLWALEPPAATISNAFGVPVTATHDVSVGAFGELRRGAATNRPDSLYVKVSSGIGAGLILAGNVYEGSAGFAGEIGHVQIAGSSEQCRCGRRGCLESLASLDAVRRQLQFSHRSTSDFTAVISGDEIDPTARRIVTDAGWTLGRVLADLSTTLDPGAIILGGQFGATSSVLRAAVEEAIRRYAEPSIANTIEVVVAGLGTRSELVGAVMQAVDNAASRR
ncbi:ROK family transcriptional regulator [Rarobacter faecitabidus]|uniref:Putative NBD/HSP70 family sugar kinase n=1 Tax=Rarobacter faecitabidus TaxID=13243 RepID=A0A542ZE76_RARFA|nr:ROK family transcriptional regulator [Rarobacter faecitabidus]TQL58628.1 putative NBD/HSP70 family sugar kinase [Rarobacter faecitabidus]